MSGDLSDQPISFEASKAFRQAYRISVSQKQAKTTSSESKSTRLCRYSCTCYLSKILIKISESRGKEKEPIHF